MYTWKKTAKNNTSKKSKPHNFLEPLQSTINWDSFVYDKRSRRQKLYYQKKTHNLLISTGYKMQVATTESTLYIKGPNQGSWNKTESL